MIQNTGLDLKANVRNIKCEAGLYNSASASPIKTFKSEDAIKQITVERVGENSKFFGFGVCQKLNIKLRDIKREIKIDTSNYFKIYFNKVNNFPLFYVSEVHRDEKTNELSITAYDKIYSASDLTVDSLAVLKAEGGYTLKQFAEALAVALNLKLKLVNVPEKAFSINYPTGANFEGTETLRDALTALAEATQTIYYTDGVNLIFKRLVQVNVDLQVTKSDYFELKTRDNRRLTTIISATELGDNISATTGEMGTTQIVRDNPFWELREDLPALVQSAIDGVGNFTIGQFECSWRGNFLLEIGDKVSFITKDNKEEISYVIDDVIEYDGGLNEKTRWSYEKQEENPHSNPANLGEALKQTFAKVDKANKQIDIVASETAENREAIAAIKLTTGGIEQSVKEVEKKVGVAESAASDAKKAAQDASQSAQNASDKIDNLSVGGRNLLLDSGVESKNAEYRVGYYTPSRILEVGETVTVSICITPADKCNLLLVYNSSGMGDLAEVAVVPNQKQVVTATFNIAYWGEKTPEADILNNNIAIYRRPNDGTVTGETTIHWIKLEAGTVATDWTPAPEDIDAEIASGKHSLENTNEELKRLEESQTATDNSLTELTKEVKTKMTSEEMKIEINKAMSNGVNKVETSTGFSFNEEGLDITKTGSEMSTRVNEDGMRISKNGEVVLTANNAGVDATNLHATTWLIIGNNSRIEDYGTDRTGVFWIG